MSKLKAVAGHHFISLLATLIVIAILILANHLANNWVGTKIDDYFDQKAQIDDIGLAVVKECCADVKAGRFTTVMSKIEAHVKEIGVKSFADHFLSYCLKKNELAEYHAEIARLRKRLPEILPPAKS